MSTPPNADPSRWWYGIALTVAVGIALYGFLAVVQLVGPATPVRTDAELVALVASVFGAFLAGVAFLALTLVYAVCFVADWKRVTDADVGWNPSPAYLLVPAATLLNLVVPVVAAPVTLVGSGYYLLRRGAAVGSPPVPGR